MAKRRLPLSGARDFREGDRVIVEIGGEGCGSPDTSWVLCSQTAIQRRKCRQDGELLSEFAADNVDISVAYPDMGL